MISIYIYIYDIYIYIWYLFIDVSFSLNLAIFCWNLDTAILKHHELFKNGARNWSKNHGGMSADCPYRWSHKLTAFQTGQLHPKIPLAGALRDWEMLSRWVPRNQRWVTISDTIYLQCKHCWTSKHLSLFIFHLWLASTATGSMELKLWPSLAWPSRVQTELVISRF